MSIAPLEAPDSAPTPSIASPHQSDMPASQETLHSAQSSTFSAPALASSSSTLSTSTTTEAESTAPSSANAESHTKPTDTPAPMLKHPPQSPRGDAWPAPRVDTAAAKESRAGDKAPSPKPLGSPATQGSKRSADGSVKAAGVALATPSTSRPMTAHKRNKSMDTHSGTRIGELSAQLKTRLSYAMVKVQNGWEKQSLEELEESQSQRGSPNSAPGRSDFLAFDSPADSERRRRPSGVSDISDQMIMSPVSDPTRSHVGTPGPYWTPATRPAMHAAANLISITGAHHGHGPSHGHSLAPAPTFQSSRRRRSTVSHIPPPLLATGQRKHYSDLSGDMRSPATPRAGILRMPSQQAEKDAVDTLLFMSSPNNSQRFPVGTLEPSPLRTEAPQRRVMFEAYPPQDKHVVYHHSSMPAPPHHHQHGPYPAHPAR